MLGKRTENMNTPTQNPSRELSVGNSTRRYRAHTWILHPSSGRVRRVQGTQIDTNLIFDIVKPRAILQLQFYSGYCNLGTLSFRRVAPSPRPYLPRPVTVTHPVVIAQWTEHSLLSPERRGITILQRRAYHFRRRVSLKSERCGRV